MALVSRKRVIFSFPLFSFFMKPINLIKPIFLAMCVAMFFASAVFASATYNENSNAQFSAGTTSNTYVAGSSVALDFNGHLSGVNSPPDSGKWYNTSYKYRRVIPLTNTSVSTLTDYRVALTINNSLSRMNADGSDLRFTTSTTVGSAISLPYAIESGVGSSSAKVWVKVPYLSGSTTTNLYMYYGNPGATALSSMLSTFTSGTSTSGDDFTGTNGALNPMWSPVNGSGVTSYSRGNTSNELLLSFKTSAANSNFGIVSVDPFNSGVSYGSRYHAKIYVKNSDNITKSYFTIAPTSNGNGPTGEHNYVRIAVSHGASPTYQVTKCVNDLVTSVLSTTTINSGYNDFDIIATNDNYLIILLNGAQQVSLTPCPINGPQYLYVEGGISGDTSNAYSFNFDNVYATPYISPEPSQGISGAEQGSYLSSGSFVSQLFDSGGNGTKYYPIDWTVNLPTNTAIIVSGAASDTNPPSSYAQISKSSGIAAKGRYFKYKLDLSNTEIIYTPALSTFSITYVSPPIAATNLRTTSVTSDTIACAWKDNSSGQYQENSVELYFGGARVGNLGAGTTQYVVTGKDPNQSISAFVRYINDAGYTDSVSTAIYTLPSEPSAYCATKDTYTWTNSQSYSETRFVNSAGWGTGGVSYYSYVWDKVSTHTFTGSESNWGGGQLGLPANSGSGAYYLHLKSFNGNGVANPKTTNFGPFNYDLNNPVVVAFDPSSTAYWINTSTTIYVTMADTGGSGISSYGWRWTSTVDNPSVWTYTTDVSTFLPNNLTVPMTITSTETVDGMVYLHVFIQDGAQNKITTYAYPIMLDYTPPTASLNINYAADYAENTAATLSCVIDDALPGSGIDKVYAANEDLNWVDLNWSTATGKSFVYNWVLSTGDGLKTVNLKVVDKTGNECQAFDNITLDGRTQITWSTATVTASGLTGADLETFQARATVTSMISGNPVRYLPVTFTFNNGVPQTANTDGVGVAFTTFNVPSSSGTTFCYMVFESSNGYGSSSSSATVNVNLRQSSILLNDIDTQINVDFITSITLVDPKTSTKLSGCPIRFDFYGSSSEATTNSLGVASVTFHSPDHSTGTYYSASFAGNSTYAMSVASGVVSVAKIGTRIEAFDYSGYTTTTFTYTAKLLKNISGDIIVSTLTFTFNSDNFHNITKTAVTNSSGNASVDFCAPISSGVYTMNISFPGDDVYNTSSKNANINVLPRQTTLNVSYSNPYVNESFPVTATLSYIENSINVPISSKKISFTYNSVTSTSVTNGSGMATTSFYVPSVISSFCFASFAGDAQYAKSGSSITITTLKRPVSMSIDPIVGVIASSSFTARAYLSDTRASLPINGSTVTFTFIGFSTTAVINNGYASAIFWAGSQVVTSSITVSYAGSGVYESNSVTGTVIVNRRPVSVTPTAFYGYCLAPINLYAKLTDQTSGDAINSSILNITFGSTTIQAATDVNGFASAQFSGSTFAATSNFKAYFPATAYYTEGSTATAVVSIYKRPTSLSASPISVLFGSGFSITGSLRDAYTDNYVVPMSSKTVTFTYNGVQVTTTTNSNGDATAYFTAISSIGTSSCYMLFPGDPAYSTSNSSATIQTVVHPSLMVATPYINFANNSIYLDAVLTELDGFTNLADTQSVVFKFYVNGATQTITAATSLSAVPAGSVEAGPFIAVSTAGVYDFSASFAGSTKYSASSDSSTATVLLLPTAITGNPVSAFVASTFSVSAVLSDWLINPVYNRQLKFQFTSSTTINTSNTDINGMATTVFGGIQSTGTYNCNVYFSTGDVTYQQSNFVIPVSVNLRPTSLNALDIQAVLNSTFTVSATLRDYQNNLINGGNIVFDFYVNGATVTKSAVTNSLGIATTTFYSGNTLFSGSYDAVFASSGVYAGSAITKLVTVSRRSVRLTTVDTLNAVILESYTVTAVLTDLLTGDKIVGASVTFTSPSNANSLIGTGITNASGIAISTFSATAPSITSTGTYQFKAYFSGNDGYLPSVSSVTSSLIINCRPVTIKIEDVPIGAYVGRPFVDHITSVRDTITNVELSTTITNGNVNCVFNSTTTSATFYQVGLATITFTAPLSSGSYPISGNFSGNSIYAPASSTATVTVDRRPVIIYFNNGSFNVQDNIYLRADLLEPFYNGGTLIANSTVTATFQTMYNGTLTSSAITNNIGEGIIPFGIVASSAGYYNISTWFSGNSLYQPSAVATGTINIGRVATQLIMAPIPGALCVDSFTATAQLMRVGYGTAISSQVIYFNGTFAPLTSTATTDANGYANSVRYSTVTAGVYNYTAYYNGDPYIYAPCSSTNTVTINKRSAVFYTAPVVGSAYIGYDAYVGVDTDKYIKLRDAVSNQDLTVNTNLINLFYKVDEGDQYVPANPLVSGDVVNITAVISPNLWETEGYHSFKMNFLGDNYYGSTSKELFAADSNGILINPKSTSVTITLETNGTVKGYSGVPFNPIAKLTDVTNGINTPINAQTLYFFLYNSSSSLVVLSSASAVTNSFGFATSSLTALNTGTYYLRVSFYGNPPVPPRAYSPSDAGAVVAVETQPTILTPCQYNGVAVSTRSIPSAANDPTRTVTLYMSLNINDSIAKPIAYQPITFFKFNGAVIASTGTDVNGIVSATFNVPTFISSTYTYTATFPGVPGFQACSATGCVSVTRSPMTIVPHSYTDSSEYKFAGNTNDGLLATLYYASEYGNLVAMSSQPVSFMVSSTALTLNGSLTNSSGVSTTSFTTSMTTGTYSYTATFSSNAYCYGATATGIFTVRNRKTSLVMSDMINQLSVSVLSNFQVNATLSDIDDSSLAIGTSTITFKILDSNKTTVLQSSTVVSDSSGNAAATFAPLTSTGTARYYYSAIFNGKTSYAVCSSTKQIDVNKRKTTISLGTANIQPYVGYIFNPDANLNDVTDTQVGINNKKLVFTYNTINNSTITYNDSLHGNGYGRIDSGILISTQQFVGQFPKNTTKYYSASFDGTNDIYQSVFTSGTVTAQGIPTDIVLATDTQHSPAGSVYYASGTIKNVLTALSLGAGKNVSYRFGYYTSADTNSWVAISSAIYSVASATTDVSGVFTSSFTAPLVPCPNGNYLLWVNWLGDTVTYNSDSSSMTLIVDQSSTQINGSNLNAYIGDGIVFKAQLTGYPAVFNLYGKNLVFELWDSSHSYMYASSTSSTQDSSFGICVATAAFYPNLTSTATLKMDVYFNRNNSDTSFYTSTKQFTISVLKRPVVIVAPNIPKASIERVFIATATIYNFSVSSGVITREGSVLFEVFQDAACTLFITSATAQSYLGVSTAPLTISQLTNGGNNTLRVTFDPTGSNVMYSSNSVTAAITVQRNLATISVPPISAIALENFNFSATIIDSATPANITAFSQSTITFTLQSSPVIISTALPDSLSGTVYSAMTAPALWGTYTMRMDFSGNRVYEATTTYCSVLITSRPVSIRTNDITGETWGQITSTAGIFDITGTRNGYGINAASLTFVLYGNISTTSVNSMQSTSFSNSIGTATAQMLLDGVWKSSGTYMMKVIFNGDTTYKAASSTCIVTLNPRVSTISVICEINPLAKSVFSASATIVDLGIYQPRIASGRTVIFTLYSSSGAAPIVSTATTDGTGVATTLFNAWAASGTYKIDAVFASTNTYYGSSSTCTLTLLPRTLVISTYALTVAINTPFISSVTLSDLLNPSWLVSNASVTFILTSTSATQSSQVFSNSVGVASTTFTSWMSSGTYNININVAPSALYMAATTTATVNVIRVPSKISLSTMSVLAMDSFNPYATLAASATAIGIGGKSVYFVFYDSSNNQISVGVDTVTTDSNGLAISTMTAPTKSQTCYLFVSFGSSDPSYQPTISSAAIYVTRRPSAIWANNYSGEAWGVVFATAGVYDSTGTRSGIGIGGSSVTVTLNSNPVGNSVSSSTFADNFGTATVNISLSSYNSWKASGTYTARVDFAGNNTYLPSTAAFSVYLSTRNAAIYTTDFSTMVSAQFVASATLTDLGIVQPRYAAGKVLNFVFYGLNGSSQVYNATTNSVGYATAPFVSWQYFGSYKLTVNFAGDATYPPLYSSSTITLGQRSIRVTADPVITTINQTFIATATLTDLNGSWAVVGTSATFSLWDASGQSVSVTTSVASDANGKVYANLSAWASSGTYTLEVKSLLSATHNPGVAYSSVTINRYPTFLTSSNASTVVFETFTITAALSNVSQGVITSTKTIQFGLYSPQGVWITTISAVTDSAGGHIATATINASNMQSAGIYSATIVFDGQSDPIYSSTKTYITILVTPRPASISANHDLYDVAWDTFTISANVFDNYFGSMRYGSAVDGGTVTFKLWNADKTDFRLSLGAVTNSTATALIDAWQSSGIYQVDVNFLGNDAYNSTSTVCYIHLSTRNYTISANDVNGLVLNNFISTATFTDLGPNARVASNRQLRFILVGVTNSTGTALTNNIGVATTTITAGSIKGTYQMRVVFDGDGTYPTSTTTCSVTLSTRPAVMSLLLLSPSLDEIFVTTACLRDFYIPSMPAAVGSSVTFVLWSSTYEAVGVSSRTAVGLIRSDGYVDSAQNLRSWPSTGTYLVESIFSGDNTYGAVSSGTIITLKRRNTQLQTYPIASVRALETFIASATLSDQVDPSRLIPGKIINFSIVDSSNNVISTANGTTAGSNVATALISAPPLSGDYTLRALFPDTDQTYFSSSASETVHVITRPTYISLSNVSSVVLSTFSANASLIDQLNPSIIISSRTVMFTFYQTTGTAYSTSRTAQTSVLTGTATVVLTGWQYRGNYPLSADFAGDGTYSPSSSACVVTLLGRPSTMTVLTVNVLALDTFSVTAQIKDRVNNTIAIDGSTATFKYHYDLYIATRTDIFLNSNIINGVASSTFSARASSGVYKCEAYFDGNLTYDAINSTGIVNVSRRPLGMSLAGINPDPAIALSSFTVTASVSDLLNSANNSYVNGKVIYFSVYLDTNSVAISTTNAVVTGNIATAVFTAPSSSGSYKFGFELKDGDALYLPNVVYSTFTVGVRPTKMIANKLMVGALNTLITFDSNKLFDVRVGTGLVNEPVDWYIYPMDNITFDNANFISSGTVVSSTITANAGAVVFSVMGPPPGVYPWKIIFNGNATYGASFDTATIAMGLPTSLLTDSINTYTMNQFTARARLIDPRTVSNLPGKLITFEFRVSTSQVVIYSTQTASDGYASVTFTAPVSSGAFAYYAHFDGEALYVRSDSTATVTVNPRTTTINANAIINVLTQSSFSVTAELHDTVGNVSVATKTLTFVFNGSTVSAVTGTNGIATAQFFSGILSSGTYTYYVGFSTPSEHTYAPSNSTANVGIRRRNTLMIAYPVSGPVASSTVTATAKLLDSDIGLGVGGQTVVFDFTELGGSTKTATTDATGVATATFVTPYNYGDYGYGVTYGNSNWKYTGAFSSTTFTVGKRNSILYSPNISVRAGMGFNLDVTLKDSLEGYAIAGRTITVTYFFITSTVTATTQTNASGVASFNYQVPASTGSYIYSAVFNTPDPTFNSSSSSGTLNVANEDTTLVIEGSGAITKIKENFNVSAVLQHSGYRLVGASVSFVFDGVTQSVLTDNFGRAITNFDTLSLTSTGTYLISAFYAGDAAYLASTDTGTLTATLRDSILQAQDVYAYSGEVFTMGATLKDNVNGSVFMGDKIFGIPVEFTLHDPSGTDQPNTAIMDNITGNAAATFVAPTDTGTYSCSLVFYGTNTYYSGCSAQCNVYVLTRNGNYANTALRAMPVVTYISTTPTTVSFFTASATLTTQNIGVGNKTIEFSFFDGVSTQDILGTTDIYGVATTTFTVPITAGNYNFLASFVNSGMFSGSTDSAHVDVSSRPVNMVAINIAPDPSSMFNTKVTLIDALNSQPLIGSTVTFSFFNGISTSVISAYSNNSGVVIASFTAPTSPGSYFYFANFNGNSVYNIASATGSVLVASNGSDTFLVMSNLTVGELEVFNATASLTAAGVPVANKTILFSFQGTTTTVQTSNLGFATVTFTAPISSNTYYIYGVFAGDSFYKMSATTATVKVIWREFLIDPSPLKLSYSGSNAIIEWSQLQNDINKIKGYWVEKTDQLNGTWAKTDFFYTTAPAFAYTSAVVANKDMFYRVKSVAWDDQESKGLVMVEVPAEGQQSVENSKNIYMSEDFSAWVTIPNQYMTGIYNSTTPLRIVLEKKVNAGFLLSYDFYATDEYGKKVDSFDFSAYKKGVLVTLSYAKLIGSGALSPSLVSSNNGKQVGLFWFNGVEWVKVGGTTDVLNNMCYIYVQKLGLYGIKLTTPAQEFTLNKVAPRIFTPEESSDIINKVRFYFENPDGNEVSIRIYDITGALVKRNLEKEADTIMYWDGTDIDGNFVKTGIYIYQVEAGKKVKNGTIVVAK